MNAHSRVEVSATTLVRAWRKAGRTEFWVQLTTTHPDPTTFGDTIQELEDPLDDVSFVVRTVGRVPKGCVALIGGTGDDAQMLIWADALARRLEDHGVTGTLTGVTQATASRWIRPEPPVPTAYITWAYDAANSSTDPVRTGRLWKLDPDTTRAIAELLTRFARPGGPKTLLRYGAFQFAVSPTDDLAKMLEAAIEAGDGQAGLWCIDDTSLIGRHVGLLPRAQTVLQTVGDTPTWEQRIDTLRDAIAERPDLLDHAFIRTAYQRTGGWRSIAMATPIPHADESLFRYNQHLTTTHVIDAHGIQVLTDAHLARLQNPDRWNIEDLGHGKHLVTAPDLAAWYADTTPNAATLEQARDDFADLLLTDDAVSAHPPPWPTWHPRG